MIRLQHQPDKALLRPRTWRFKDVATGRCAAARFPQTHEAGPETSDASGSGDRRGGLLGDDGGLKRLSRPMTMAKHNRELLSFPAPSYPWSSRFFLCRLYSFLVSRRPVCNLRGEDAGMASLSATSEKG